MHPRTGGFCQIGCSSAQAKKLANLLGTNRVKNGLWIEPNDEYWTGTDTVTPRKASGVARTSERVVFTTRTSSWSTVDDLLWEQAEGQRENKVSWSSPNPL